MPFGTYKTLGAALKALQITETRLAFLEPKPVAVSDYFRSELEITLRDFYVNCSEVAVCENLLFPLLREAYKPYAAVLTLWSHVSLHRGEEFMGVPDYIVAKRSELSPSVMETTPYALIVEAKKNDFDAGWGQCLAAMQAVQTLNGEPQRVVYGIVSDGFVWRFGQLREQTFNHHPDIYVVSRLDELLAVLNRVFELCRQQVLSPASAA
jgi:hypothetical protein